MDKPRSFFQQIVRWFWVRAMLYQRGMTLGVRVIATDEAGKVLLVRHGYTPGWHLPGGGVDRGETFEQAAGRELQEETGWCAAGPLKLLGLTFHRNQWKGDHVAVYATSSISQQRTVEPGFEIAETGFFALDSLPDGTTQPTRARLAEWQEGRAVDPYWS